MSNVSPMDIEENSSVTTGDGKVPEFSQENETKSSSIQDVEMSQTENSSDNTERKLAVQNTVRNDEESRNSYEPQNKNVMQSNNEKNETSDATGSESKENNTSEMEKFQKKSTLKEGVESNTVSTGNEESQSSADGQITDVIQNCYCGKERNLNIVELQCAGCYKWFHESCITISLGKCLPFMTYYTFFCKLCNPSGNESFAKKQPNFGQMCGTALANLTQQCTAEGQPRTLFSKDKEVIPYIVANWEYLTPMQRRIKHTWHTTVHKAVLKDNDVFICEEKGTGANSSEECPLFGLVNQDLTKIGPCYENMSRGAIQKQSQDSSSQSATGFSSGKGRSAKRRFFGDGQLSGTGKRVKSDLVMPKLPPNGYPLEHPFNKDGYRYILAEPDPHAPFRREFDESQDWAGKPIPKWLYRKLTPNNVLIALHDRAPQLKVSEDRLSVTGEKGYCMARATHGVNRGTWYFECTIEDMNEGSATRLGWSQALGNLQAPLGYDKFSYSWRSRKGTKFHESRGIHYSDGGYSQGDVLGFLIHLPPTSDLIPLPPIFKDKPLVKFKSYLYYEEKDEPKLETNRLKPLSRSKITFFKNGKGFGVAYEDIYSGTYYPAVSMYKNCTISLNFGPNFKHPPDEVFKSMCEAAPEAIIEQTMTDLLYFTENKGKLRLDTVT